MLEAALDRKYSANPGESLLHRRRPRCTFDNFDAEDNGRVVTVRDGPAAVGQPAVRAPDARHRPITRCSTCPSSSATLFDDRRTTRSARNTSPASPIARGSEYLAAFLPASTRTSSPAGGRGAACCRACARRRVKLATIYRSIEPKAEHGPGSHEFVGRNLPEAEIDDSHAGAAVRASIRPSNYNLADRGYLATVHPLELWLVGYLRNHQGATLQQALEASQNERQNVYGWLFKTRRKGAQDSRIRQLVELEAFLEIHKMWKRLGYPFDSLVPSYATALGSSADRPAALAELMGILVNDGIRMPTLRLDALQFAKDTPYETRFVARPLSGERVMPHEVAQAAKRTLALVVEAGTAKRLRGAFTDADGKPYVMGGKTGTGDHRFETYGKGGVLLSSRVVSRSGTFVFYIGDRHFGTLTAYVKGPDAAKYQFTSALPTQILKTLAPQLRDEIGRAPRMGTSCAADAPLRPATRLPDAPPAPPSPDDPAAPGREPEAPKKSDGSQEPLDTVPASTPQPEAESGDAPKPADNAGKTAGAAEKKP
jgi:hypothetical protein